MNNEHSLKHHPISSRLTARLNTPVFLWTPQGFILSPKFLFNFLLNLHIPENFEIHVVQITGKCIC